MKNLLYLSKLLLFFSLFNISNLSAQTNPISDKGIFMSKFVEKVPYQFQQLIIEDLCVNAFGYNVSIQTRLSGLRSSSLSNEEFANGKIPENIVDVVEMDNMAIGVIKYYIQKINEETYHVYKLITEYQGEIPIYKSILIDVINKNQFNLKKYTGEYKFFIAGNQNADYGYYEDKDYNRIWHGSFAFHKKYDPVLDNELIIKGNYKHDLRDGNWVFIFKKGNPSDSKSIDWKYEIEYRLGKILNLKIFSNGKNGYEPYYTYSFSEDGFLVYIDYHGIPFKETPYYMDELGFLNGKITKVEKSFEEIWEYEKGIEKFYLKRNVSTGEVLTKKIMNDAEFNQKLKIVELNRNNLPERLDYPLKPKSFISDIFYTDAKRNLEIIGSELRGDNSSSNPQVGYYYTFEPQQTRGEIAEIERQKLAVIEKERLEKERIEKESNEKERLAKERIERERLAAIEKEKLEKERIEKERLAAIEKERLLKEQQEKDRILADKKNRMDKVRLENERIENEKLEKERLEKERLANIEKERLEKERLEKERIEKERLAAIELQNKIQKERTDVASFNQTASNKESTIHNSIVGSINIWFDSEASKSLKKSGAYLLNIYANGVLYRKHFVDDFASNAPECNAANTINFSFMANINKLMKVEIKDQNQKLLSTFDVYTEQQKCVSIRYFADEEKQNKLMSDLKREREIKVERDRIVKEVEIFNNPLNIRESLVPNEYAGSFVIWYDNDVANKLKNSGSSILNIYVDGTQIKKHYADDYLSAAPDCGASKAINHRLICKVNTITPLKIEIKDQNQKLISTINLETQPKKCTVHQLKI
jgi:hypothetical protein